jgi:hypothetical protein
VRSKALANWIASGVVGRIGLFSSGMESSSNVSEFIQLIAHPHI